MILAAQACEEVLAVLACEEVLAALACEEVLGALVCAAVWEEKAASMARRDQAAMDQAAGASCCMDGRADKMDRCMGGRFRRAAATASIGFYQT